MGSTIILASASPRRTDLLAMAGVPHSIKVSAVDETPGKNENPAEMVRRLSRLKAEAVVSTLSKKSSAWVIGADTTVVNYENQNLGKPRSKTEACHMIKALQGRKHFVFTGYSILRVVNGEVTEQFGNVVRTDVHMKKMSREEIVRYVKRGESMDKAGAYAAQGYGMALIEKIVGSYTNVVGLPVAEVLEDLKKLGWKSEVKKINERTSKRKK